MLLKTIFVLSVEFKKKSWFSYDLVFNFTQSVSFNDESMVCGHGPFNFRKLRELIRYGNEF